MKEAVSETSAIDDDSLEDEANVATAGTGYYPYHWFQQPAPAVHYTFALAIILLIYTVIRYHKRVQVLKNKFGSDFRGSLRFCAKLSAYNDNDEPTFATARLVTKSVFFLALLQMNYHRGFVIMMVLLVVESCLDAARILLAYWNCRSLQQVQATSQEEAKDLAASTQLEAANVYEDLTRPRTIAVMVFLVQTMLIGIVMFDSYSTTVRTCFAGAGSTDTCPMLNSMGSYALYFMGTFMACVFYVGPMNSYGKKEHDPVFWLKLFLMSKQSRSMLTWTDPATGLVRHLPLRKNDWRIWMRFVMSFTVNSVCFHFLLHVLPVQIASKSSIMGVVFSSVGMIYLVDLDDTSGTTMTLVPDHGDHHQGANGEHSSNEEAKSQYQSVGDGSAKNISSVDLEAEKQRIIDEAVQEVTQKLEALARGEVSPQLRKRRKANTITNALFSRLTARKNKNEEDGEEARLVDRV